MKPRLSILLGALSLLPLSCREEPKKNTPKETPEKEEKEEIKEEEPAAKKSLLSVPAGAVISDLTLPYVNKNKRKVSLLTIEELVVEDGFDNEEIVLSADTLKLWLFDRNGAIRSTTTIPAATYLVEKEQLQAEGEILMIGSQNQFAGKSTGGTFSLATGQAFLFGPATTRFDDPQKKKDTTAMKLRHLAPLGAAPILIAAPPEVTPQQLADFERKVAPRMIPYVDGVATFEAGDRLNRQVTARMTSYLDGIGKGTLISQTTPQAADEDEDPLEDLFKPGPQSIVIECSKGLYLDGENREIVYLGDIEIKGRGLTMTCNRDLKAIFNPPPEPPKSEEKADEEKEENPLTKFGGFGDLKQFTANGKVRLSGVNEKGQKLYFGGDRALYEMTKEGEKMDSTITMRGDKLAFRLDNPGDEDKKASTLAQRSTSENAWVVATIKDEVIQVQFSPTGWETVIIQPE